MTRFKMKTTAAGVIAVLMAIGQAAAQPDVSQMSNAELVAKAPPADDWRGGVPPVAAELRKRILDHKLSDDDWRSLLLTSKTIYSRPEWPEGKRFAIGMAYPIWLTSLLGRVSATPRLPHASTMSTMQTWGGCALGNDDIRERRRYQEVGDLPPDTTEVVLDVEFRTSLDSSKPAWAGTLTLPVRPVRSPLDGLESVRDPKLDAILLESLTAELNTDQGSHPAMHLWLFLQPARAGKDIDQANGLHLTLTVTDGEKTVATVNGVEVEWKADNICLYGGRADGVPHEKLADKELIGNLLVSITADRPAAFHDLKRSKFWDGKIVVPIKDVFGRSTVKPRVQGSDPAKPVVSP
jgi:hypothetical protein